MTLSSLIELVPAKMERPRCARCRRLLPEKDPVCPACVRKRAALRRILGFLTPYRGRAALLAVVMALGTLAELLPPFLIQHLVDDVLTPRANFGLLVGLVLGLLGARLVLWLAEVGRGWLGVWLGGRITADMRGQLFRRLQGLPVRFFDDRPVGLLLSRMTKDVERVEEFLVSALPVLVTNGLMLVGILAFLFATSWRLTLYVLLPVPVIVLGGFLVWGPLRLAWERQSARWSRLTCHLNETLAGIRVVKVFTQEEREAARFDRHNEDLQGITVHAERRSFAFFTSIYFLMSLGLVVVWYLGGRQVLDDRLTLGELLAVIAYLWLLYWPLQWLGQLYSATTQALAGAERIFEVLDTPTEATDDPHARPLPAVRGQLSFRAVTFGYDPAKPVLRDFSLDIAPGETIGLVGRSGAGKTTAACLLCRLYDPDQGTIELDGLDLRTLRLQELRAQLALVPQEPLLFRGSILENLRYGRPEASVEEVLAAARGAGAHGFIVGKEDGYDAEVGERGGQLSGGERQRLAIARALVRGPKVLILDEATSSVDGMAERRVVEALARLRGRCTTLVIAHRLSTVRHADRIVVLDGGRVAEIGTYEELLARQGIFHELALTQQAVLATGVAEDGASCRNGSTESKGGIPMNSRKHAEDMNASLTPDAAADPGSVGPRQVRLFRDPAGVLRLTIGEDRAYANVRVVRALPLSDPGHHLCILDEQGEEICLIAEPTELDEATRGALQEELDRRYLTAQVQRIDSVRNEPGVSYFDVQTNRGPREFVVQNIHESVRWLGERRLLLVDVDGNRFEIPDLAALDRQSVRLLQRIL